MNTTKKSPDLKFNTSTAMWLWLIDVEKSIGASGSGNRFASGNRFSSGGIYYEMFHRSRESPSLEGRIVVTASQKSVDQLLRRWGFTPSKKGFTLPDYLNSSFDDMLLDFKDEFRYQKKLKDSNLNISLDNKTLSPTLCKPFYDNLGGVVDRFIDYIRSSESFFYRLGTPFRNARRAISELKNKYCELGNYGRLAYRLASEGIELDNFKIENTKEFVVKSEHISNEKFYIFQGVVVRTITLQSPEQRQAFFDLYQHMSNYFKREILGIPRWCKDYNASKS